MSEGLAKKLLIVGWDAADWKLITPLLDAGQMPALGRLIDAGVMGNLATLRPCLSPMLWTSIATGKTADAHGVCGFIEPLEDGSGVKLVGSTSRKTKALWNICTQAGLRTHVVGWYASHPAEPISGVCVSDQFCDFSLMGEKSWGMAGDAVHPAELRDSVAALRMRPEEIGAADLLAFIPELARIGLRSDPYPAKLAMALARCGSTHAIATAILEKEPWDVMAVYYDTLDRAGHEFMPFHPPRMEGISAEQFELYQHVMTGLYRFHDMMLSRLLELAGDEVTVMLLSDHGFHSDHLRPRVSASTAQQEAALWHRDLGVLVMSGPGIVKDQRVYGASLLDIAPTALALLGLPAGRDMAGKALVQCFDRAVEVKRVASWDQVPGEAGLHPAERYADAFASAAVVQHLVELGYLAPQGSDVAAQVDQAAREAQFNLATVHLHANRPGVAQGIFGALVAARPEEPRYVFGLAQAMLNQADGGGCAAVLEAFTRDHGHSSTSRVMYGQALLLMGRTDAALVCLEEAVRGEPSVGGFCALGKALGQAGRYVDGEGAYRQALAIDADSEIAHFGLSQMLLLENRPEEAAQHALRAVGLVHYFPQAHYALGLARQMLNDVPGAVAALEMAVQIAPNFPEAHTRLAELLLQSGQVARAMQHRERARGGR